MVRHSLTCIRVTSLLLTLLLVGSGAASASSQYKMRFLDTSGFTINDLGQILGYAYSPMGYFLMDPVEGVTQLDSGLQSAALNDHGQVAGELYADGGLKGTVREPDGSTRFLPDPTDADNVRVFDIDDSGRVIGTCWHSGEATSHIAVWDSEGVPTVLSASTGSMFMGAWLGNNGWAAWSIAECLPEHTSLKSYRRDPSGAVIELPSPSDPTFCRVSRINDKGCMAGESGYHAVVWNADLSVTDLGVGRAVDINDAGQIIGCLTDSADAGCSHPMLWEADGAAVDLAAFSGGYTPYTVGSINNLGQILGSVRDADGQTYSVLWEPVPEPSSFAALTLWLVPLLVPSRKLRRGS